MDKLVLKMPIMNIAVSLLVKKVALSIKGYKTMVIRESYYQTIIKYQIINPEN